MSIFTEEDFKNCGAYIDGISKVVNAANAKLEREGVVVFNDNDRSICWVDYPGKFNTHQALLINPQPIEKECEVHILTKETIKHEGMNPYVVYHRFCEKCGDELKTPGWQ